MVDEGAARSGTGHVADRIAVLYHVLPFREIPQGELMATGNRLGEGERFLGFARNDKAGGKVAESDGDVVGRVDLDVVCHITGWT